MWRIFAERDGARGRKEQLCSRKPNSIISVFLKVQSEVIIIKMENSFDPYLAKDSAIVFDEEEKKEAK